MTPNKTARLHNYATPEKQDSVTVSLLKMKQQNEHDVCRPNHDKVFTILGHVAVGTVSYANRFLFLMIQI